MYHIVIKKPSQNSLSKLVIVEKFINAIETKLKSRLAIGGFSWLSRVHPKARNHWETELKSSLQRRG